MVAVTLSDALEGDGPFIASFFFCVTLNVARRGSCPSIIQMEQLYIKLSAFARPRKNLRLRLRSGA